MENKKDLGDYPIKALKGVGDKIKIHLEAKGIKTIEDLIWYLPVRYEDRRTIKYIKDLKEGDNAIILTEVSEGLKRSSSPYNKKKTYVSRVTDITGSIVLKWFHGNWTYLKNTCEQGNILFISGKVTRFGRELQIIHPDLYVLGERNEINDLSGIIPIYTEIRGIKQGTLRNLIKQAFKDYDSLIESVINPEKEVYYNLISFKHAISVLHLPSSGFNGSDPPGFIEMPYRERLILEEYLLFQLALSLKKAQIKKEKGIMFSLDSRLYNTFIKGLGFDLTDAQKRVMEEIKKDMASPFPMNRLLQGDVGCGKTICAVLASCIAIDNGYQVAFMAPTEILAEQHYLTIHRAFEEMGISTVFLRGNMGKERERILQGIQQGNISVIVGTHALIQNDVVFKRLGLVIIDEQHRFGVIQRRLLKEKAINIGQDKEDTISLSGAGNALNQKSETDVIPHTLVMTATPIPRTLSMVVYGDLDVSIIDEIPKGRQTIETRVMHERHRVQIYKIIEDEVKKGRQAYIVYPLVDESDKMDLLNAKEMASYLMDSIFPSFKVGLLHGKMRPEEKEEIMGLFKKGMIDILVCTTVIEVGIDCPNASVIVIEHAERFGLSQLHQLRGRVGRGIYPSRCILIASSKKTDRATKRLKVMEETTDGFTIAEEDMKIRGPGDIMGQRQSGIPYFRIGNIVRDGDIMSRARQLAEDLISRLTDEELCRIKRIAEKRWGKDINLSDIA